MIGGVEQKPTDFDREITWRIAKLINPKEAWKMTVEYEKQFPKEILENSQRFYKLVYEPVRDIFISELLKVKTPKPLKETVKLEGPSGKSGKHKTKTLLEFFT